MSTPDSHTHAPHTGEHDDVHVARFGRWAASYDGSPLQRILFGPIQEAVIARATREVPSPRAVLDVGCGTGQLLRRLAARFPDAELTGVDPSSGMIAAARAAIPEEARVALVEARAEDLPFAAESFDLVVTTLSFHHWADQPTALREVVRVLRPGGAFLLADALPTGWLRWAFVAEPHGTFNRPERLAEMLADAGLEVAAFEPVARFGGTIQIAVGRRRGRAGSPVGAR